MTGDVRDRIFESLGRRRFTAVVVAAGEGVLAGMSGALSEAEAAGCGARPMAGDGDVVRDGTVIVELTGPPKALASAEESVMGALAKPSGIATAARELVECAGPGTEIVGGGWKKMPRAVREMVRDAVVVGGASTRIEEAPFLYLDKNYVRMFGGVAATLDAVASLEGYRTVIQIGHGPLSLEAETRIAVEYGVSTLFVDTGDVGDLHSVINALEELGARDRVRLAFGGGIGPEQVEDLAGLGVDALCVGRAIVDAPLLDLRMEILDPEQGSIGGRFVSSESPAKRS